MVDEIIGLWLRCFRFMGRKITAVKQSEFGPPEKVLKLVELELADLKPDEVLVTMKAAPINPADLNIIEGRYGLLPQLPFIPGNEGVGIISRVGGKVTHLAVGQKVIAPFRTGFWCEAYVCDAVEVIPLPESLTTKQAAMLTINPPTAWLMLNEFVRLSRGDWLIQNAANSGVGRFVIQFAQQLGLQTVNIVRRKELVHELKVLGGDVVATDKPRFSKDVKGLTNNAPIKLGLNAVGDRSALEIATSLTTGGTLITYGAMARVPFQINNALLIFGDLRVRGFWRTNWFANASREKVCRLFEYLVGVILSNNLEVPVEEFYSLADIQKAIRHAQQDRRTGKILLTLA